MAKIERKSGFGNYVVGTYRTTANIDAYAIAVINASSAAVDIRGEDDGANEYVEALHMALNPIGFYATDSNAGLATVLVDGSQWDAAALQSAVRHLGTASGPNNIDGSLSTVTAATTLTAA